MPSQSLPWICISEAPVSVSRPSQIVPSTQPNWLLGHFLEKRRLKTSESETLVTPGLNAHHPSPSREPLEPDEVAALRNRWLCLRRPMIGKGPHDASQGRGTARAPSHINTDVIHILGGLGVTGTNRESPFMHLSKCEKHSRTATNEGTEQ